MESTFSLYRRPGIMPQMILPFAARSLQVFQFLMHQGSLIVVVVVLQLSSEATLEVGD
jgi:hypothetical protein